MKHANDFFAMQRERYRMLLRRRSRTENYRLRPCPWGNAPSADGVCRCDECLMEAENVSTRDPVLSAWRFCNVFREDDRTTEWFRKNIRDPLKGSQHVFMATVAFRWFNRIETGEKLKPMLLDGRWDSKEASRLLYLQQPIVTGAFMVKTPAGMDKLAGVCWCIDQVNRGRNELLVGPRPSSLEGTWNKLREFPYFGPFMSYEVVSDLRHTWMCNQANDIMTWANAGPGCTRGMGRVSSGDPKEYNESSKTDQAAMLYQMKQLLSMSSSKDFWPSEWPKWEMREVEHGLCEFDKYCRGRAGEKLKRRYP